MIMKEYLDRIPIRFHLLMWQISFRGFKIFFRIWDMKFMDIIYYNLLGSLSLKGIGTSTLQSTYTI